MPSFLIQSTDRPTFEVESDNWMGALEEALARLALPADAVECDVDAQGDVAVTTPSLRLHIREVREATSAATQPRLGSLPLDLPPAAFAAPHEDDGDRDRARAYERADLAPDDAVAAITAAIQPLVDVPDSVLACNQALDLLLEYVPAQSGAVLLVDRTTRDLYFACARGPQSRGLIGMPVPSGRGIAGLTVRAGIALCVREANADPRHYREIDLRTGYQTHALLSVPLRGVRQALGCIQLLNPVAGTTFESWHQVAAQVVSTALAERLR